MCVWASGDEAPSFDKIKEAMDENDFTQIKEWRDTGNRELRGNLSKISGILCRTLDDLFRSHFVKSASKGQIKVTAEFMGQGEGARKDWESYRVDVIDVLRKAQSQGGLPRGFTARATLDLIWMPSESQPIPFLTEGVVEAWTSILATVTGSTTEVSIRAPYRIDPRTIQPIVLSVYLPAHRNVSIRGTSYHHIISTRAS
jgi:hypothetical protein